MTEGPSNLDVNEVKVSDEDGYLSRSMTIKAKEATRRGELIRHKRKSKANSKQRAKKVNQASLVSVESIRSSSPKKIVEVKDKWVKVRVTMDSGAAGHVMLGTMVPHVKFDRNMSPKKFVAASGEQIKDLGEKIITFKTNEGVQRCITFRSARVVKPLISMQKVVRAGNTVVLDEKNPHIRNTRDGTVIKLDVSSGVHTMDTICLDETGPAFSWQGQ